MHVTLLLPGALLPREVIGALQEPLAQTTLAAVLARAELVGDTATDGPAHLAWLAEHLFHRPLPLATGPYAYAALAGTAAPAPLWHADPVHVELARDHLVVTPLADLPSEDEATALIGVANELAQRCEARVVTAAGHWFLQTTRPWSLQAVPLTEALGRPLQEVLPTGDDALAWSRLLTEIQMAWHAHPVNAAREARGEATVNSVWLHGGGQWQRLTDTAFTAVQSDAPEWRGAAWAASIPMCGPRCATPDGALVVWTELLAPRVLHDWSQWLATLQVIDQRVAALARISGLDLVLTGDAIARRLTARAGDRLRFWRARSLEQALAE